MAAVVQEDRLDVSFVSSVRILAIEKFEYSAISSAWIDVEHDEFFTNQITTVSGKSNSYSKHLASLYG